jgi:hypothetical protein
MADLPRLRALTAGSCIVDLRHWAGNRWLKHCCGSTGAQLKVFVDLSVGKWYSSNVNDIRQKEQDPAQCVNGAYSCNVYCVRCRQYRYLPNAKPIHLSLRN